MGFFNRPASQQLAKSCALSSDHLKVTQMDLLLSWSGGSIL